MKAREIDDNFSQKFEDLPEEVRGIMTTQVCVNCEKPLDEKKIMYVLSPRGFLHWWHHLDAYDNWRGVRRCDDKRAD